MKFVQASKAYDPHVGGIETVVKQLAEGVAGRGWESSVVVASDTRRGVTEVRNGVTVRRAPTVARALSLPIAPTYGHALGRERGDVLLVHEPTLLASGALFARRDLRRRFDRLVVWWHSDIVRQRAFARAYRPVLDALLRASDAIIVATPNHISSSDFLPPYESKIDVVPFGIDLDDYRLDPVAQERMSPRLPERFVLFVGRLGRYKGLAELAAAMDQLPDIHLVIVGEGPCLPDVTASAAYQRGRVRVLSHLRAADLVAVLHACEMLVLPSIHQSEAFGIVLLEAMACRRPVVTFDLPTGVTYVNRDGDTGRVVPLGDADALAGALRELWDDDVERRRLGEQARQWVEDRFALDAMITSTMSVVSGTGAS